ncbi:MAG: hypothetical protein ACE5LL_09075 [Alphaproteobacteria bacterium]
MDLIERWRGLVTGETLRRDDELPAGTAIQRCGQANGEGSAIQGLIVSRRL